jgi:hypothetical protein
LDEGREEEERAGFDGVGERCDGEEAEGTVTAAVSDEFLLEPHPMMLTLTGNLVSTFPSFPAIFRDFCHEAITETAIDD